jgi:hypothetical protein
MLPELSIAKTMSAGCALFSAATETAWQAASGAVEPFPPDEPPPPPMIPPDPPPPVIVLPPFPPVMSIEVPPDPDLPPPVSSLPEHEPAQTAKSKPNAARPAESCIDHLLSQDIRRSERGPSKQIAKTPARERNDVKRPADFCAAVNFRGERRNDGASQQSSVNTDKTEPISIALRSLIG